jgi:hypothetical protein
VQGPAVRDQVEIYSKPLKLRSKTTRKNLCDFADFSAVHDQSDEMPVWQKRHIGDFGISLPRARYFLCTLVAPFGVP